MTDKLTGKTIEGRPLPWCRECGVRVSSCDEDGCCSMCGVDLFADDDGNLINQESLPPLDEEED